MGLEQLLSSDKHWHAVLEHYLALLESYDSNAAVSAVTRLSLASVVSWSLSWVTAKHCLMTQSLLA